MIETAQIIDSLYEKFLHCGAVSTDSRRIVPGSIFFALRGDSFDGNTFAIKSLENGAAYAVVDDPQVATQAADSLSSRIIIVHNALGALQQLAARHRFTLNIPVLAITGTNGKTTTKELIYRVLAQKFNVSVTQGNLNNHIGVPLTLLAMDKFTQFAIVEMGASACEEIALLCRIAQPDYGLITNIGLAHLEGFRNIEGVKKGKGELFDYLAQNGGVAFYCSNDATLSEMVSQRPALNAVAYEEDAGKIPNKLEGDYNIYNIAACVAVGEYFEVPRAGVLNAVESYEPDNNRSQVKITGRNRLIIDCYNANPSSMSAAINNFATSSSLKFPHKAAILGDMLELGEWSGAQHSQMLELLLNSNIDQIYLVGDHFMTAAAGFPAISDAHLFRNTGELVEYLSAHPLNCCNILIKGSRGIKLENVVSSL